jgi:branched-chain amino acid transport system ATP-binding protein
MNLLETKDLRKYFGGVRAVDGISLSISAGDIVGLIGPNGAGKTTFLNLLAGYIKPSGGKIFLENEDITIKSYRERIKRGVVKSFQIPRIFGQLSCLENVKVALFSHNRMYWKLHRSLSRNDEIHAKALEILDLFGLRDKADLSADKLSGGDRKLLDVAIAMCLEPKLLLLDEPTSGISTKEKIYVMDNLSSILRERGITAIIVEHDMEVVFAYTNKVAVMHEGKLLGYGKPEEIKEDKEIQKYITGA